MTHGSLRTLKNRLIALAGAVAVATIGIATFSGTANAADVSGPTPVLDAEEQKMVTLINDYRVANGLNRLTLSKSLTKATAWMSVDLQSMNDLSHDDTLGRDPFQRMAAFGYTASGSKGENIAGGYEDAASTFEQWKSSPHHNDNMLRPGYKSMGLARAFKAGAPYEWYWTNDFGGSIDTPFTISGIAPEPTPEVPLPTPQGTINGSIRSAYVPLTPQRLFDTRGEGAALTGGSEVSRMVLGKAGVPTTGVAAVVLTVTLTQAAADGYVTVYPADVARPDTSSLNVTRGGTVANLVTVPVTASGAIAFFTSGGGQLIADVAGYYATVSTTSRSGRFMPAGPTRVLDTRGGAPIAANGRRVLHVTGQGGVPTTGVSSVSINLTLTGSTGGGFATAYPAADHLPNASNLNVTGPGQTVAGAAIVPVDANGDIAIYLSGGGHLLVDINGWFTDATAPAATTGLFVPQTPNRTLDTRRYHALRAGSDAGIGGPANAVAVSVNLTMTGTKAAGFLTAWPTGTVMPNVSSLNASGANATVANHAIIATAGTGIRLATSNTADLLVDIDGWYIG